MELGIREATQLESSGQSAREERAAQRESKVDEGHPEFWDEFRSAHAHEENAQGQGTRNHAWEQSLGLTKGLQ